MAKKKILICGATGFIGRNLCASLAQNMSYEVYGTCCSQPPFNQSGIKMLKADLTNRADVDRVVEGMDVVIQAAATTSGAKEIVTKPYYHVTDNALMNSLIFRAAYAHKVKQVVFFSCTVMYQSSDKPLKESDFDANAEMYPSYFGTAWTKVYIEKMCEFYSRISDTKYTVLRHSNIYGPHDKFDLERSHVFGATMTKVLTNTTGKIVVWGTGETARDLLYVTDLIDCVKLCLAKQESKFDLLNIGSGQAVSVLDLVKRIIACSGKEIEVEFDASKPNIKTRLALDCSKARQKLGWQPTISLSEGIQKTMSWYRANLLREVATA